jgi:hypothetical protein
MKFRVATDHPVAVESRDHTHPGGTMHDSSTNPAFNKKLYELFPGRKLMALDLGCAGGGFVRSLLDDGHEAVGLEGSDYSLRWDGPGGTEAERARRKPGRRAEWANIPDNLFTADITKPFVVDADATGVAAMWFTGKRGSLASFDVVTAWEVMEHLPEAGCRRSCENVKRPTSPKAASG